MGALCPPMIRFSSFLFVRPDVIFVNKKNYTNDQEIYTTAGCTGCAKYQLWFQLSESARSTFGETNPQSRAPTSELLADAINKKITATIFL